MLFNSYIFWFFLAAVLFLYRRLPHRGQNWWLLVASNVFYGSWNWRFLWLIWLSVLVDFAAGLAIQRATTARGRRVPLVAAITASLCLLGFFKYYGFFAREAAQVLGWLGMANPLPVLNLVLPVGISFYTFQSLSYVIDVYRGRIPAETRMSDYALYVFYFPQLVAGPIERASHLLGQIGDPTRNLRVDFREGLYHVMLGLFKKVVIADNLAVIANTIFRGGNGPITGAECLVAVYAFAFQIYGDFSGYSSIAKGVARWMGFELMDNFRHPYLAASPSEFWQRWHISLSTWLRDYLYIPLGGNRDGRWRTGRNLMLTMLLGGLWHGASWTFLAWGAFHGVLLCVWRLAERPGQVPAGGRAGRVARTILIFHLVCFGWLLFRAESITQAAHMAGLIATDLRFTPFAWYGLAMIGFYVAPLLLYELYVEGRGDLLVLTRSHWLARGIAYVFCAVMLFYFSAPVPNEFIYFQF
jgi:alginate O-acetyltransferase complex protein AlgI